MEGGDDKDDNEGKEIGEGRGISEVEKTRRKKIKEKVENRVENE